MFWEKKKYILSSWLPDMRFYQSNNRHDEKCNSIWSFILDLIDSSINKTRKGTTFFPCFWPHVMSFLSIIISIYHLRDYRTTSSSQESQIMCFFVKMSEIILVITSVFLLTFAANATPLLGNLLVGRRWRAGVAQPTKQLSGIKTQRKDLVRSVEKINVGIVLHSMEPCNTSTGSPGYHYP